MVIRPDHRHDKNGDTGPSCGMWLLPRFQLDNTKDVTSITLPEADKFHVFGITLQR